MLRPLPLIKRNLDDMAAGDGDLTHRCRITSQDEIGERWPALLTGFVEKIHGLVQRVAGDNSSVAGRCSSQPSSVRSRRWKASSMETDPGRHGD